MQRSERPRSSQSSAWVRSRRSASRRAQVVSASRVSGGIWPSRGSMICDVRRESRGEVGIGAPEGVVLRSLDAVAGPAVVGPVGSRVALHVLLDELGREQVVVVVADDAAQAQPFPLGRLLGGHELAVAELRRALHGRIGPRVPQALQVRIAPRSPRYLVVVLRLPGGRRHRHPGREHERQQSRRQPSMSHLRTSSGTNPARLLYVAAPSGPARPRAPRTRTPRRGRRT